MDRINLPTQLAQGGKATFKVENPRASNDITQMRSDCKQTYFNPVNEYYLKLLGYNKKK